MREDTYGSGNFCVQSCISRKLLLSNSLAAAFAAMPFSGSERSSVLFFSHKQMHSSCIRMYMLYYTVWLQIVFCKVLWYSLLNMFDRLDSN